MATVDQVAQAANICGVMGTALMVWPAIKATRLFLLIEAGKKAAKEIPANSTTASQWMEDIVQDLREMQQEWKPFDAGLLFCGLFFTGLSYLLPLLKVWWNFP